MSKYPGGYNFKPGSSLHDDLVRFVNALLKESHDEMQKKYESWRKVDRTLTSYIPADTKRLKAFPEDSTAKATTVVMPLTYAGVHVILTYLVYSLLSRPIFKYEPSSPEDTVGVALLEKVVDLHTRRSRAAMALLTMFHDILSYGVGAVLCTYKKQFVESGLFEFSLEESRRSSLVYEGNMLDNIDVYRFFPDVSKPLHKFGEGRYIGWVDEYSMLDLIELENAGKLFNVDFLKKYNGVRKSFLTSQNARMDRFGGRIDFGQMVGFSSKDFMRKVDVSTVYVRIIPKEMGLGSSTVPEKWLFRIAGDKVLVWAEKLDLLHGKFPVAVGAANYNGHVPLPTSIAEIGYGLQETGDWAFRSHAASVDGVIKNRIVYDPSRISTNDLKNPIKDAYIRTKRAAWGQSVRDAIYQLQVNDVTAGYMKDLSLIKSIYDEAFGTTDIVKGIARSGERVTAREIEAVMNRALSRLEIYSRSVSLTAMFDLAIMMASNVQQFMTEPVYVKTIGRYQKQLEEEYGLSGSVKVTPSDLDVNFDVVPATSDVSKEDANLWLKMLDVISRFDDTRTKFNITLIVKHIARILGLEDFSEFEIKVMPDDVVERNVEAGNLVSGGEYEKAGLGEVQEL